MVNVSGRKPMHGGNSCVIGWIPRALETFTASVELSVKARPKWHPQAAGCH